MFAFVGGYTTPDRDGRGNGINVYRIDAASGAWTHLQNVGGLENPSLFTLNRAGTRMWSVHGGRNLISAFAIDPKTAALVTAAECDTDIVYKIGDPIKAIVLGVDYTTFEVRASTSKFSEIHDRKRVAQYMKAPPPLTLGQLLSPEKEG